MNDATTPTALDQAAARRALDHLPQELRSVLDLGLFGRLDYRTVADRLGLPPALVLRRMRDALAQCGGHLEGVPATFPTPVDSDRQAARIRTM